MYDKELGTVFLSRDKEFIDELCSYAGDNRVTPLSFMSDLKNVESSLRCLQPELIVIDDSFSEITAARLAQRIRVIRFYRNPLIIVLSGKTSPDYVELCASAGVDATTITVGAEYAFKAE